MIVWSGRGFLIPVVLVLSFILLAKLIPTDYSDAGFVLALAIGAAFSWFAGKKWNAVEGQILVDKKSGQEVNVKPDHSLFFIKMEYWGIVLGALAIVMLISALFT